MKRVCFAALILVLVMFPSCANNTAIDRDKFGHRFVVVHSSVGLATETYVIRDSVTGREYLFVKSGYGAGLALMPEEQ